MIVKNVVPEKQQGPIDEFEALIILKQLGINAPKPIARLFTHDQQGLIVIEALDGTSGRSIKDYFETQNITADNQRNILRDALNRMKEIAESVRRDIGFDKPWRLKDFMIKFTADEKGQVVIRDMKPLDFERAKVFDPNNPHSIELGQELDDLLV